MDVNLRKTATDTAYIVVGVGVLGFQQAQVRRRDAMTRVSTLQRDARSTLQHQTDSLKSRTDGCAGSISSIGATIGGVGTSVSNTVSSTVAGVGSSVSSTVGGVVSNTVDAFGSQVKAGADVARTVDPRGWVDPVVGDIRVRVEPVIEQVRTISLPGSVTAIPDQVAKVIDVGRARVQGGRGTKPTPVPKAVNGDA
jgi:hypothetical protein